MSTLIRGPDSESGPVGRSTPVRAGRRRTGPGQGKARAGPDLSSRRPFQRAAGKSGERPPLRGCARCYATCRSPLRGKAGLASRGTYGSDREVNDLLRWTDRRGPGPRIRCRSNRTNQAALPNPHPNGTPRVTSDMTGLEPGRRRSVGTYRSNWPSPLNVRGRARVAETIYSPRL
jgi:hypothetical protein